MGLTREERQLLHQKSKQPTFGSGKPDSNQGNEGDIAYRQVEDSGLVQYVKQNGSWVAVGSQGDMPETRDVTRTVSSGGGGVGSHNHGEFIKKDGSVAYTGNQSFGTNNITNVGTLDVDGATTLDQVTINTTDGAFAVSGTNPINLSTSGSSDINISSGHVLDIDTPIMELDVGRDYTINVGLAYILNVTDAMVVTGSNNITIQATGTAANTLLIENRNSHASSFDGIHLKTNSNDTASCFNKILIECDNVASKGSDYGIDIRSENNIRIRAEHANNGNPTGLLMRATGPIDIGVGTSLTPHSGNERVKVHGLFETSTLYRASGEAINCSTHSVEFDQLDTQKLMRNFTYKTNGTLDNNEWIRIVAPANEDFGNGTVWLVSVFFSKGTQEGLAVGYCFSSGAQRVDPEDTGDYSIIRFQDSGGTYQTGANSGNSNLPWGGKITWAYFNDGSGSSENAIRWQNTTGLDGVVVKASAQRIQSTNDFS
tara:strand:- start:1387 stop:2841 length:1455 start_codon:yes stop_codon:yes gene_type:complete